jgi:tripartite-type tricarboxylate transporter receptor subunit TctC
MKKRLFLQQVLSAAGVAAFPGLSFGNSSWPDRPIRLVVPTTPGGAHDLLARDFALRLAPRLGQPVVVDNKPGAGTVVGTVQVAKSPADGYTLLLGQTALIQNPLQMKSAGYDPIKDFTPLARIGASSTVQVVRSDLAVDNAVDFVKLARGKAWNYGSSSPGPQVIQEVWNKANKIGMVSVSYKGEGPCLTDLLGGNIQTGLFSIAGVRPHIESGKLKAIAAIGAKRIPSLPNVPTFLEQGFKEMTYPGGWYAFMAPAKLPTEIADRLTREIKAVLDEPAMRKRLAEVELIVNWADGATFAPQMKRDMDTWRDLLQQSGVTFDM